MLRKQRQAERGRRLNLGGRRWLKAGGLGGPSGCLGEDGPPTLPQTQPRWDEGDTRGSTSPRGRAAPTPGPAQVGRRLGCQTSPASCLLTAALPCPHHPSFAGEAMIIPITGMTRRRDRPASWGHAEP